MLQFENKLVDYDFWGPPEGKTKTLCENFLKYKQPLFTLTDNWGEGYITIFIALH